MGRTLYLFLAVVLLLSTLSAQGQQGEIQGQVIKKDDGKPAQFTNVIIKRSGESKQVEGTTTGNNGRFEFENLEFGSYTVVISYVSYQNRTLKDIQLSSNQPVQKLDTIQLFPSSKDLSAVEVQEEQGFLDTDLDGLTINPDENITQTGGNAMDILQNTPSVQTTFDGGIRLRGAEAGATKILVNGKNTALSNSIDQIPASAIENIEIIHNPGAEYEAAGSGGIINIVLKKQRKEGTNGRIQMSAGNRNRYNTSINLNHTTEDASFYINYDRRNSMRLGEGTTERTVYQEGEPNTLYEQDQSYENRDMDNNIRAGADFSWNYFNEMSIELMFAQENETEEDILENKVFSPLNQLQTHEERTTEGMEDEMSYGPIINYTRTFAKEGRKLDASISYNIDDNLTENNTQRQPLSNSSNNIIRQQRDRTDEMRHIADGQVDFVEPVSENGELQTGIRSRYRLLDNNFDLFTFNRGNSEWQNRQDISNHFVYEEFVHAGYLSYKHELDQWTFSGGIRAEQTSIDIELRNEGTTDENSYLNFFPSAKVRYKLDGNKETLKAGYSKRIDRPSSWRLNPFPDVQDSLSIFIGNPDINPEYIHSFELGHNKQWENATLSTTAFYRQREGIVDYITSVNEQGTPIVQPTNLNRGVTYGLEGILSMSVTDWWNFNLNASAFNNLIEGELRGGEAISNENISWYSKLTSNWELPNNYRFQVTGNYSGPEVEALEEEKAQYYIDAAVKKSLLDGKASIAVNVTDVFNTLRSREIGEGPNFDENRYRKRESRRVMVTLDYKFDL